jgi:hypothetical protein
VLGELPSGRPSALHAFLAAFLAASASAVAYSFRSAWFYDGHLIGCGLVVLGLAVSGPLPWPRFARADRTAA